MTLTMGVFNDLPRQLTLAQPAGCDHVKSSGVSHSITAFTTCWEPNRVGQRRLAVRKKRTRAAEGSQRKGARPQLSESHWPAVARYWMTLNPEDASNAFMLSCVNQRRWVASMIPSC